MATKKKTPQFVMRNVDDLIPYINNARTHSEKQVNQVASSIKEFGFMNPVIISDDNGILAGHCRVMAAKKLGIKEVPCMQESHLSEAQKKAYILADNKLAENAGWDFELVRVELETLKDEDFNIELTGFDLNIAAPVEDTSREMDLGEFGEEQFDHICPKCKFRFND